MGRHSAIEFASYSVCSFLLSSVPFPLALAVKGAINHCRRKHTSRFPNVQFRACAVAVREAKPADLRSLALVAAEGFHNERDLQWAKHAFFGGAIPGISLLETVLRRLAYFDAITQFSRRIRMRPYAADSKLLPKHVILIAEDVATSKRGNTHSMEHYPVR